MKPINIYTLKPSQLIHRRSYLVELKNDKGYTVADWTETSQIFHNEAGDNFLFDDAKWVFSLPVLPTAHEERVAREEEKPQKKRKRVGCKTP